MRHACGFCRTGMHQYCPGSIAGAAGGPGTVWTCVCSERDHADSSSVKLVPKREDQEGEQHHGEDDDEITAA